VKAQERVLAAMGDEDPSARVDADADHPVEDPARREDGPAGDRLERSMA
jgi:hypothetical protein